MAEGDIAKAEGYPIVPDIGEEGLVKWGAREINRTRDFVAEQKRLIPISKAQFRTKSGISAGTANPANASGENGDIYLKVI